MTEYTEADVFYAELYYARQGIPTAYIILKDDAAEVAPDDTIKINGKYTTKESKIYPASFNFKDETDYTDPTSWTITENGTTEIQVIPNKEGHNKVLKFNDDDNANQCIATTPIFSGQPSGTIEYWVYIGTNGVLDLFYVELHGSSRVIHMYFQVANNRLSTLDGTGWDNYNNADLIMNSWIHIQHVFDKGADTIKHYCNGVLLGTDDYENSVDITHIKFFTIDAQTTATYYCYLDAIGYSWDTNYNIGDNIFWKNYKDSMAEANFEGEALYTSGTNIEWVDSLGASAVAEIVGYFDNSLHKKYLKYYMTVAWNPISNTFSYPQATGTIEFYIKFGENNLYHYLYISDTGANRINLRWTNIGKVVYYDGTEHVIGTYVAGQWYHIKIEFDCGDDWHLWIDGVSKDGGGGYPYEGTPSNMQSFSMDGGVGMEIYLDAVGYSWESDYDVGDNLIVEVSETTFNTVLFDGRIEDVDMEAAQGIYCISKAQELIQHRPSLDVHLYTDVLLNKIIYDKCNIIQKPTRDSISQFEILPDADITKGDWTDEIYGDNDGDLFDELRVYSSVNYISYNQSFVNQTCEFSLDNHSLSNNVHYDIYKVTIDSYNSCGFPLEIYFYDGDRWIQLMDIPAGSWRTVSREVYIYTNKDNINNFKVKYTASAGAEGGVFRLGGVKVKVDGYTYQNDIINEGTYKIKIESEDSTIKDISNLVSLQELKTWYLDPNWNFYFNDGDHKSGISLTSGDNIAELYGKRKIKSYDKVVLHGGYVGGVRIKATAGTGNIIAKDTYNKITNITVLQNLANQLLAEKGANTYDIELLYNNQAIGLPQVGETLNMGSGIKFDNSNKTVPANDYIMDEIALILGEGGVYQHILLKLIDILIFSIPEEQKVAQIDKQTKENADLIIQK